MRKHYEQQLTEIEKAFEQDLLCACLLQPPALL